MPAPIPVLVMLIVGDVLDPVIDIPVPALTDVTGAVPEEAVVSCPSAFTVMDAFVYDPAVTPVLDMDTVSVGGVPVIVIPAPPVRDVRGVDPEVAEVICPELLKDIDDG